MQFAFFILLNAILFIRPAELIEALAPLQLYQLAILGCLATSYPGVLSQLGTESLMKRPLTLCVVGILVAIVLSHLQFASIYDARSSGSEFGKVVLYFLLLQHNLDAPEKFQKFLNSLVVFTLIAASLALAQYHHFIDIPALAAYEQREIDEETGEIIVFPRLCGSGIFNDPNDVCLMLTIAMMICTYRLLQPGAGPTRFFWLAPIVVFFLAFIETKSRGGFIALMIALNVLLVSRVGFKKALPFWLMGAPVVLVLFGGRMTKIEVEGGTGQHRVQLWREALGMLREYPLFGVGQGMLAEYTRLVAHNSYVHAFAELGIFGGSCFISVVYLAISQLKKIQKFAEQITDPEMRRLGPYLLGIVCGFCAGIMSLSRVYIVPTYMVFGLAAAYVNVVKAQLKPDENGESPLPTFNSGLFGKLFGISIASLLILEFGSRLMVRWE
ncbi:MAG TPA: O-antigen ligase family protein [Pirellulaceae bacterium]|nr:O-antigen ligase family protein [Pirellulaceae bacterium]